MARFLRVGGGQCGVPLETADLGQRPTDPVRVPRELHRRGIRQKFPLTRYGTFDQLAEENPDISHHHHQEPAKRDQRRDIPFAAPAAPRPPGPQGGPHHPVPHHGDDQYPVQDPHQPDVQAHVAVENMAEFMRDHALQFVPRQLDRRPAREAHHRIPGIESRGKGVDGILPIEQVNGRHLRPGRNGHLLHHVHDLTFQRVGRGRIKGTPSQ